MTTTLLIFIVGVISRALVVLFTNFRKEDLFSLALASFMGFVVFLRADEFEQYGRFVIAILIFTALFSFFFKDRIISRITEGTLLLNGLVTFYLFHNYIGSGSNMWILEMLFALYVIGLLILCIKRIRVSALVQTTLVACFLLSNVLIILTFFNIQNLFILCQSCLPLDFPRVSLFFAGFVFFQILGNILYVLYFIPIPLSKHQSFKERLHEIKEHGRDLEQKYIDIDINFSKTIIILIFSSFLFINSYFGLFEEALVVSIILMLGDFFLSAKGKDLPIQS